MYPRELGDLFEGDQIVVAGRFDRKDLFLKDIADHGGRWDTQLVDHRNL